MQNKMPINPDSLIILKKGTWKVAVYFDDLLFFSSMARVSPPSSVKVCFFIIPPLPIPQKILIGFLLNQYFDKFLPKN